MKGRKPDPGAGRRGTARHRKSTEIAPIGLSGAIGPKQALAVRPPTAVPQTKAVKHLWRLILAEVARHELRAADLPLIEAMFVAKVRHAQAGAYIKKHGVIIFEVIPAELDEDGNVTKTSVTIGPCRNPMLAEERQQAILYDRLAQRLGLSPEARIRLDLMQIAGATLLSSLKKGLDEVVDSELAAAEGEVEDAQLAD